MAKNGGPRPLTCTGGCGGTGKVPVQTGRTRIEKIDGKLVEVEIIEEKTCSTCNGKGTI